MNKKADLSGRTLVELLLAVVMIFILAAGIIQITTSTFSFTSTKEKKESAERNFEALGDLIENLEPGQEVDGFPIYLYSNKHVIVGFERDKATLEGVCVQGTGTMMEWKPDAFGGGDYVPKDISDRIYWASKPPICSYEAINKEDPIDMVTGGCLCICESKNEYVEARGKYELFEAADCQCLTEKDFGREISFIGGNYSLDNGDSGECAFGGLLAVQFRDKISTLYVKRIMGGDGSEGEYVKLCENECENQVYDEYMNQ
jgi:hypothetical protein